MAKEIRPPSAGPSACDPLEFQNAMQAKFMEAVERLTGRNVLALISNHHVGPDIEIELLLLTPSGTPDERIAIVPEPDAE